MKTIFFGSSEYVIPILEVLKNRFGLSLIVTTEKQGSAVNFAEANNIRLFSVSDHNTLYKILNTDPPLADLGIVADFGLIIPKQTINLFQKGILNIHPSLLPQYRGPTPVQTTILNGDKETGVTIIKLDEEVDHGPILAQEEYEIEEGQTAQDLLKVLFNLGANLLGKTLVDYMEEILEPTPQDEKIATYTKKLTKADGRLNLETLEIGNLKLDIERAVRAYYPWPGVWFREVVNGQSSIVKLLPGNMIQVEGKKPQNFKDFINGYKEGKEILGKLKLI